MGPLEQEVMSHVREVRARLRSYQSPVSAALAENESLKETVAQLEAKLAEAEHTIASLRPKASEVILESIITMVCRGEKVPLIHLVSKRRDRQCVLARQICFYLSAVHTSMSYPKIGRRFGHADHTSALYGKKVIEKRRLWDSALNARLKAYESAIGA